MANLDIPLLTTLLKRNLDEEMKRQKEIDELDDQIKRAKLLFLDLTVLTEKEKVQREFISDQLARQGTSAEDLLAKRAALSKKTLLSRNPAENSGIALMGLLPALFVASHPGLAEKMKERLRLLDSGVKLEDCPSLFT